MRTFFRRIPAAGARHAPAAFLFGLLLTAVTAGAHDTEKEPTLKPLPPGAGAPAPSPPVPIAPPDASATPDLVRARPLRALVGQARIVALADVTRTETYDGGALLLHRLRVARVLRGRIDQAEPGVVEIRGASRRPPLVVEGERAVLLLVPAGSMTYLAQHLPEGAWLDVVGGRGGVLRVGSEAEADAVETQLEQAEALGELNGPHLDTAVRNLAFAELASPSPRLATDALLELRGLPAGAPFTRAEADALGRALRDTRVDVPTRVGLIELAGAQGGPEARRELAGLEADDPAVLDALLAARARLGMPAGRDELAAPLASPDGAVRAAAVKALARSGAPGALAEVGRYAASDRDEGVRLAAIEALGQSRRAEAAPLLAGTFDTADRAAQQKSGQALLALDDPAADDALVGLALRGRSPETRKYATLLLLASRGREHPAVRRVEAGADPEVRKLLEHGLEFQHSHQEH